jgi:hypothetical protein
LRVQEHDGRVDFMTFDWEHCGLGYRGTDLARVSKEWTASDFERYCEASRPSWSADAAHNFCVLGNRLASRAAGRWRHKKDDEVRSAAGARARGTGLAPLTPPLRAGS